MITSGDQLNGIRDYFPAHQRSAHTFSAHRDPIRDGYGIELHGCTAGLANSLFHRRGKFSEMKVARADFRPGICNSNYGTAQVLIGESDGFQHGARWGPAWAVSDRCAVLLQFVHRLKVIQKDCPKRLRPSSCWMMASDSLFSSPSTRVTEPENACKQENSNDQQQ